jgi:hypothetical protein
MAGVPFPSGREVAPQGVERRLSFDGLWRRMRAFDVSVGSMTNTLTLNPSPERRGECAHG